MPVLLLQMFVCSLRRCY